MMPKKQTNRSGTLTRALLTAALSLSGSMLMAQNSGGGHNKITAGEILMYIAGIIVVILIAWVLVGRTSSSETHHSSSAHRKTYDHPNDPHFRKLKKKTS
jgi:hypothetical protein